jgi:hypothetical protein
MRSLQKTLFVLTTILPAAMYGCSSDSNNGGAGGTGGATGGRGGSSGGSGGSTGGSSGGTTGGTGTGGATGGSSGGTTGGTGTGGTTGGTGTGGTSGGADAAPSACGGMKTAPMSANIDNFEGMSAVQGGWNVYHDADTAKGVPLMPVAGALEVKVVGANTHAAALLAMWAATNRPCLDGSAYQGIKFKVTGDVKDLLVRIGSPATYPVAEGGICMDNAKCGWTHYQKNVTASLTGGGMAMVAFSELTPPWGAPGPFDKSALLSLVFLTTESDMTKKFTIDDIAFY